MHLDMDASPPHCTGLDCLCVQITQSARNMRLDMTAAERAWHQQRRMSTLVQSIESANWCKVRFQVWGQKLGRARGGGEGDEAEIHLEISLVIGVSARLLARAHDDNMDGRTGTTWIVARAHDDNMDSRTGT